MLTIDHVAHSYQGMNGDGVVQALSPVSFSAADGEFVCIVGPSGCGKSTLLRIIAGLVTPTQGSVRLNDQPITTPHHTIGLIFQTSNLMPWRSVIENIELPLELAGVARPERTRPAPKSV